MGQEVECVARHAGVSSAGRAQLETDDVRFRGDFRVVVPFAEVTAAEVAGGTLEIAYPGGPLQLELGARAERWADRILHPKTVIDKLGVKPGQRVALRGLHDAKFRAQLDQRGAQVVQGGGDLDHLFVLAESPAVLGELPALRRELAPDGGLWTIRRKGKDAPLSEGEVRAAGRGAGLLDVKVVRFSDTHTADRFVIPKAERA